MSDTADVAGLVKSLIWLGDANAAPWSEISERWAREKARDAAAALSRRAPQAEAPAERVGIGWPLSEDTIREIEAIEDNIKRAAAQARNIIVGARAALAAMPEGETK